MLNQRESAKYLGVSDRTFRRWLLANPGRLPTVKIRGIRRYDPKHLDGIRDEMGKWSERRLVCAGKPCLTGAQAARYLSISRQAFALYVAKGRIAPYALVNGRKMYTLEDVEGLRRHAN